MMRKMKAVVLKSTTAESQNAVGKFVPSTTDITIDMAISILSGNKQVTNNILTTQSTHIGLTNYKSISKNDTIIFGNDKYTVDYIPPNQDDARLFQVFLKLVN